MKCWLVVTVVGELLLLSAQTHCREYSHLNANDVIDLVDWNSENARNGKTCTKIRVSDSSYQQLMFLPPPYPSVVVFPEQLCAHEKVFDQNICDCTYDGEVRVPSTPQGPCSTTADVGFNTTTNQYESKNFLRLNGTESAVDLNSLTDSTGIRLNGTTFFVLDSFTSNDLRGPYKSSLKFNPSSNQGRVVLLTDECVKKDEKGREEESKSLEVVLTSNRLEIFMRFANGTIALTRTQCNVNGGSWNTLNIDSINGTVVVKVNGVECARSNSAPAELARTQCPLYVGGNPKDRSSIFNGWLDYFWFIKGPEEECQKFYRTN